MRRKGKYYLYLQYYLFDLRIYNLVDYNHEKWLVIICHCCKAAANSLKLKLFWHSWVDDFSQLPLKF